jgi:hypothetical protein
MFRCSYTIISERIIRAYFSKHEYVECSFVFKTFAQKFFSVFDDVTMSYLLLESIQMFLISSYKFH